MRPDIDLRGFLDTRAALVLLTLSVLALAAFAALGGLIQPSITPDRTAGLDLTLAIMVLPLTLIVPVLAVPIIAGEWSDTSIQNTFLQRPARGAVLASKAIAASIVVLAVLVIALGLAALSTWVGGELLGEGATYFGEGNSIAGQLAALLAVPYLLNVLRFHGVTDTESGRANAGWKTFLWLNYLTGSLVTMLLIWWAAVRPV